MSASAPERVEPTPSVVPPFAMLLPRGWVSEEPTRTSLAQLSRRVSTVFRGQHRPDLDARFQSIWQQATSELLRRDPLRIIYPADVPPEELFPLSLVVVRVKDPAGMSLDRKVRELVRRHDAKPMDAAATVLRWSVEDRLAVDGGAVSVTSFNYLIAIPGTERREAVMISGVLPTGATETLDDDTVAGAQALTDAIVSTFAWRSA